MQLISDRTEEKSGWFFSELFDVWIEHWAFIWQTFARERSRATSSRRAESIKFETNVENSELNIRVSWRERGGEGQWSAQTKQTQRLTGSWKNQRSAGIARTRREHARVFQAPFDRVFVATLTDCQHRNVERSWPSSPAPVDIRSNRQIPTCRTKIFIRTPPLVALHAITKSRVFLKSWPTSRRGRSLDGTIGQFLRVGKQRETGRRSVDRSLSCCAIATCWNGWLWVRRNWNSRVETRRQPRYLSTRESSKSSDLYKIDSPPGRARSIRQFRCFICCLGSNPSSLAAIHRCVSVVRPSSLLVRCFPFRIDRNDSAISPIIRSIGGSKGRSEWTEKCDCTEGAWKLDCSTEGKLHRISETKPMSLAVVRAETPISEGARCSNQF